MMCLSVLVAGEFLRHSVCGRQQRLYPGHAGSQHPAEFAGVRADSQQVPRTTRNSIPHRDIRVIQVIRRQVVFPLFSGAELSVVGYVITLS